MHLQLAVQQLAHSTPSRDPRITKSAQPRVQLPMALNVTASLDSGLKMIAGFARKLGEDECKHVKNHKH